MPQYMSGEKEDLLNSSQFERYYLHVKETTKEFPNLNCIKHGNTFCNEFYNGYDLSYLCVRYLSEILTKEDFKGLIFNSDRITEYGKTILEDMMEYYDDKFYNKNRGNVKK